MALKRRPIASYDGDPLIPIMNLVCMLIPLLLYGAVFIRFVTVNVNQQRIVKDVPPSPEEETLNLTVMITDQGFHLKVNPRFRLPWMSQASGDAIGPDIPKKNLEYDYAALNERLREIKERHREETRIIVGAEDNVAFDVLVTTMDYARGTDDDRLFPDVTLTRGLV